MLAHAGIAAQVQLPELLMTPDEAGQITDAAAAVARHYDIAVLDPKIMDWLRLGGVLCGVYGGKAIAIYQRRSAAQQAQAQQYPANGMMPGDDAAQMPIVNLVPHATGAVN